DVNVCVSLFDGLAFAFHSKLDSYGSEPKVVVVTSINPKLVGAAGKENYEKLIGDGSNQTPSSSKLLHAQKIEPLTISELNKYVITSEPQIILCTAKVNGTQTDKGWCYIGSSKCSTKLQHRVELSVSDLKDDAVFVAFDMEIVKLTSIQAFEAAQILEDGQEPSDDVPMEKLVASNGFLGADNTLAEVASGVRAEGGETTTANHQPSSSIVAGLVRSASTIPNSHT
ncbi:hypothetical protein IGI04_006990, partial [Brassica rapa subsp. trilocularis]